MMIDISHVSDKTFYDVLELSTRPVMASHSSLRALCDIPRNMSDDMVKALARKGGVIFINFNAAYIDPKASEAFVPLRAVRDREISEMMKANRANPKRWEMKRAIQAKYRAKLPRVDIGVVLRHIDHAAKIAGAEHVGMGSDFDGISGMAPAGLEDVSKYPAVVKGLIAMGYSDRDIRNIMGENLLRLMRAQ
jgi:membrane dipeptidase